VEYNFVKQFSDNNPENLNKKNPPEESGGILFNP
jgi:hypothetical protein